MKIPRTIIDEHNRIQDRIKAGKKKPLVIPCPTCGHSMTFNPKEVKYTFIPSPDAGIDFRKDSFVSENSEYVSRIEKALAEGDEWAWCSVECRAEWNGFTGSAYLGGCSLYDGEKDFIRCNGKDMKA